MLFFLLPPFLVLSSSVVDILPKESRLGLALISLDQTEEASNGEILLNQDAFFPPASTLKLLTALAAKLELGDEFKFTTEIESLGDDMVLRFSGDPTLLREDLVTLLKEFTAKEKVSEFNGTIWLDNSDFTGYSYGVGLPWDILGVCYSAPSSAIVLDENCVQASISIKGGETKLFIPQGRPLQVETRIELVSKKEQEKMHCDLELHIKGDNHYQLAGCMTDARPVFPLKFAINSPETYTQEVIRDIFSDLNVDFNGDFEIGNPNQKGDVVATHYSDALPALLKEMLVDSSNLIADNLTKTIGSHFYAQTGSFTNGTTAIKEIIKEETGINLDRTQIADGSGLSRNSRLTVNDMVSVLRYLAENDSDLGLIDLMPVGGEDGTLKYNSAMLKRGVKGKLVAKSGSLHGSRNMAGYGLNEEGEVASIFVQFVSEYYRENETDEEPTADDFEEQFYREVVSFSR